MCWCMFTRPYKHDKSHRAKPYAEKPKKEEPPDDIKRGGWFTKCQRLCKAIIDANYGTARELADEYYAG